MKLEPKKSSLLRTYLVYVGVLVFGIAILVQIIVLMTRDNKEYAVMAEQREYATQVLEASRGNIFSADGNLIATSVPVYDIFFDTQTVEDKVYATQFDTLCQQMAELLPHRNVAQWKDYLNTARAEGKRYHPIAKNISLNDYRKMQQFAIFKLGPNRGGIIAKKKIRRARPYNELAGRMIGYVNENEKLFVGIEGAYNDHLKGVNGQQLVRRIHHGGWILENSEDNADPRDGADVYTTFDIKLQDIVENALNNTLTTNKAEMGCAILMDVETGYVRALANLKLNHETNQYEESYNFALAERYEPGSVFKIASMTVLLNNFPEMKLTDKVNIGTGPIKFSNRTMRDDHTFAKDGICTVQEVIEQSSNKGTAVLVTKSFMAHPEKYVDGLYALGLNKKTGTGIAGEAQPLIKHPTDKTRDGRKIWSNVSLPWMSIGYEVNVTPMQLLTLYNAIANGGRMMKPQFVTEIRNGNQTIEKFEPVVLNEQIASPEAIAMLQTMLEGVVQRGTAKRQLADCAFPTAGKTGTAQYCHPKLGYKYREPGVYHKLYNTTFVGYFPADKPKYSCIVVVNRARGPHWAAGSVSAPGFREIAEKVYALRLGIEEDQSLLADNTAAATPAIVNRSQALEYLNGIDATYTDYSINEEWVTVEDAPDGSKKIHSAEVTGNTVPNVVGMNITDAVYLLEGMGIEPRFNGKGVVTEQSLHAGDSIKGKCIMNLKLAMK